MSDYTDWLAALVPGDRVAVWSSGHTRTVGVTVVARVTATQVIVRARDGTEGTRFRCKDGFEVGDRGGWHSPARLDFPDDPSVGSGCEEEPVLRARHTLEVTR